MYYGKLWLFIAGNYESLLPNANRQNPDGNCLFQTDELLCHVTLNLYYFGIHH